MSRCIILVDKILDGLVSITKSSNIDEKLFKFLSLITGNYMFMPENYLFNFELFRLEFTSFGAMKNMTEAR